MERRSPEILDIARTIRDAGIITVKERKRRLNAPVVPVWHLTDSASIPSIAKGGLIPRFGIGEDAQGTDSMRGSAYYFARGVIEPLFELARPEEHVSRGSASFFYTFSADLSVQGGQFLAYQAIGAQKKGLVSVDVPASTMVYDATTVMQAIEETIMMKAAGLTFPEISEKVTVLAGRYWSRYVPLSVFRNDYLFGPIDDDFYIREEGDFDFKDREKNLMYYLKPYKYSGKNPNYPKYLGNGEVLVEGKINPKRLKLQVLDDASLLRIAQVFSSPSGRTA